MSIFLLLCFKNTPVVRWILASSELVWRSTLCKSPSCRRRAPWWRHGHQPTNASIVFRGGDESYGFGPIFCPSHAFPCFSPQLWKLHCSALGVARAHGMQLPSRREIPEAAVWQVLQDVGQALRHVHATGLVHLDVKPANLLIGDEGADYPPSPYALFFLLVARFRFFHLAHALVVASVFFRFGRFLLVFTGGRGDWFHCFVLWACGRTGGRASSADKRCGVFF